MKTILPIFTISIVFIHLNFDNTKHLSAHTTHIYTWVLLNNNNNNDNKNNIGVQQSHCWYSWFSVLTKNAHALHPMYYNLYQLLSRHFYHCTYVFTSFQRQCWQLSNNNNHYLAYLAWYIAQSWIVKQILSSHNCIQYWPIILPQWHVITFTPHRGLLSTDIEYSSKQ